MISRNKFEEVKEKYGFWGSWALWVSPDKTPKSNVGDLSIFEGDKFLKLLQMFLKFYVVTNVHYLFY